MDIEKIAKVAKDLKESNEKIATFLLDICDFLKDHEVRLQALENVDLENELHLIKLKIESLDDPRKFSALKALDQLRNALGMKEAS